MADRKITDLTALAAGSQATGDFLTIVDVSEAAAVDKNKKITFGNLFYGIPKLLVGTSTARANFLNGSVTALTQVEGSGSGTGRGTLSLINNASTEHPATFVIGRSNANTIGSNTLVANNDWCGRIAFSGNDGSEFVELASVSGFVDGTPGSNDMPGRLVFSTTADGASSPTERMRIDSSGSLLVGTSSASGTYKLQVNGSAQIRAGESLSFQNAAGSGEASIQCAGAGTNTDLTFKTATSERMRITSAGSVEIDSFNNLSAGYSLRTGFLPSAFGGSGIMAKDHSGSSRDGCAVYGHDGISFHTNGPNERMRITDSTDGQLLIGNTSGSSSAAPGVKLKGGSGATVDVVTNAASNLNVNHVYNTNATRNGYRYYLSLDGGIRNFSGSNVNLSDEREKKNIVDMDSTWSELKQWTLRQFHFNDQDDSEDKCYGVVAQQIETVSPQVLSTFETNPTTTRKGVKEQKMMWMAIKALQEAQARIETLETKVAALEAG